MKPLFFCNTKSVMPMKIKGNRSDLKLESKIKLKDTKHTITILFKNVEEKNKIKKELTNALSYFLNQEQIFKKVHFLVIGLGNDNFTSDSIGPKVLKELHINAFVNQLGLTLQENRISALEPGSLYETGIDTAKIVKSVVESVKPNILICLDAFVCENKKYLNHSIEITNCGIIPGSGLKGWNQEISKKTIGIPVITIGIPTAIELLLENTPYLLSTKDIDEYVAKIAKLVGESLNEVLPTYGLS